MGLSSFHVNTYKYKWGSFCGWGGWDGKVRMKSSQKSVAHLNCNTGWGMWCAIVNSFSYSPTLHLGVRLWSTGGERAKIFFYGEKEKCMKKKKYNIFLISNLRSSHKFYPPPPLSPYGPSSLEPTKFNHTSCINFSTFLQFKSLRNLFYFLTSLPWGNMRKRVSAATEKGWRRLQLVLICFWSVMG